MRRDTARRPRLRALSATIWGIVIGVIAVVLVLGPQVISQPAVPPNRTNSGILSGAVDRPSPRGSADAGLVDREPAAPGDSAGHRLLQIDFDELRMGAELGDDWVVSQGGESSVAVAPLPNAADRSARLSVSSGQETQTCRRFEPAMSSLRTLAIQVMLNSAGSTASIELRNVMGDRLIAVVLGTSGAKLHGTDTDLERAGAQPGHWYSTRLTTGGSPSWYLGRLGGPPEVTHIGTSQLALRAVAEICLGVNGSIGSSVNYDNLFLIFDQRID